MITMVKKLRSRVKRAYWTYRVRKTAASTGKILLVNGPTYISRQTFLGNNVNFNGMRIIGKGKATIGDNFHSGNGCVIMTHYHNFDGGTAIPYDNTYIVKDVMIGDNVWFGINVTVLAGITIGEGAIIQAGSVVVSDVPPMAIAGGHPAKVFKYRNEEHYNRLKSEGKFY